MCCANGPGAKHDPSTPNPLQPDSGDVNSCTGSAFSNSYLQKRQARFFLIDLFLSSSFYLPHLPINLSIYLPRIYVSVSISVSYLFLYLFVFLCVYLCICLAICVFLLSTCTSACWQNPFLLSVCLLAVLVGSLVWFYLFVWLLCGLSSFAGFFK